MSSAVSEAIEALEIVELSGERFPGEKPKKLSLAVELEGQRSDEDSGPAAIRASVTVINADTVDSDEPEVRYKGVAQYYVLLKDGANPIASDDLIEFAWPYLRSSLLNHSQLVGFRSLKLPLTIRPGEMNEAAPAWLRKETDGDDVEHS